jgi:hypothetical protein
MDPASRARTLFDRRRQDLAHDLAALVAPWRA